MVRSRRHDLTVFYFAVHDSEYPRNTRIRQYLSSHPAVAEIRVHLKARLTSRVRTKLSDLAVLWKESRKVDVIIVSEFALPYAWPAALVARLRGARLVVDGFVGAYETVIGDLGQHSTRSLQALRHRLTDRIAVQAADLFLVDTRARAQLIEVSTQASTPVLSLPVGAPDWAVPAAPAASDRVQLLFYGSFLPLHGVDLIIDAMALMQSSADAHLTLVGGGGSVGDVQQRVHDAGLQQRCDFLGSVPPAQLAELIANSHIVFGVFGDSPKARSVIPNKVWQGLACGRTVVTRDSSALEEIADLVENQLFTVVPRTATTLAEILDRLLTGEVGAIAGSFPSSRDALERYVAEEFEAFGSWLTGTDVAPGRSKLQGPAEASGSTTAA